MTSSTTSFSQMRHEYIKNWPNVQPFKEEKDYENKILRFKEEGNELFLPHPISYSSDKDHNIAVSFIIDALDVMPIHPNFAFDFIFRAFDQYSGKLFNSNNLKASLDKGIDKWVEIISQNAKAEMFFNKLLENIPQITGQYLQARIFKGYDGSKNAEDNGGLVLKRLLASEKKGRVTVVHNQKMKKIIEGSFRKFGFNERDYDYSIRDGSRFLLVYLKKDSVKLPDSNNNDEEITVDLVDKMHLLVHGILYTMRNDRVHGDSSSSFKSSKASFRTYAHNHFCFISMYFLLHLLMIDPTSNEMNTLITTMDKNVDNYVEFYKSVLGK